MCVCELVSVDVLVTFTHKHTTENNNDEFFASNKTGFKAEYYQSVGWAREGKRVND